MGKNPWEATNLHFEQTAIRPEHSVRLLGWGTRFFLAAVLTAAQLSDGSAPFALGCVAAAGQRGDGIAALLGTAAGALLFQPFGVALPHMAAAILILTTAFALQGTRWMRPPQAPGLWAGGLTFLVGFVYVLQSLSPMRELPPRVTAAVLTGISVWMYQPAAGSVRPERQAAALRFLAVTVLSAFVGAEVGGLSVGRCLLVCLVMVTGWQRGVSAGMREGFLTGLLMDLFLDRGVLLFSAVYAFVGMAAGMRTGKRRISVAAVCLGGVLLTVMSLTDDAAVALLKETAVACPLLLVIPGRVFGGKRLQREKAAPSAVTEGIRRQLDRTAAAFRDLYDSLGRAAVSTEENPAVVFDRAAEQVCRGCALCELCWKKEYVSTFNALNDATPYLLDRGRPLAKDFPAYFTARCIHMPEFLSAVGGELSAFLLRRQYRRQMEESRRSQRAQYARVGELLSAAAAGLGETAPAFAAERPYRIGAVLRPKAGETVCGDSVASFESGDGLLCLLLSDGSGSGEGARRESALTVRLLRQFLEAGIHAEAALKTLNAALALRSEETGAFSTIDLMTVALSTGETALYKYGAAPTYVKKGGSVRRITGHALPAGLRESPADPDVTRLTLKPGSFAVMISDGVADAMEDDWLQDLLAGWEGEDPQTLAGLVMQTALRRGAPEDDCGVQVLYFPAEETAPRRV